MKPLLLALALVSTAVMASPPTQSELATARSWSKAHISGAPEAVPFSFVYGGQPSSEFLKSWKESHRTKKLDDNRTERIVVFTDPATKLSVNCKAIEYSYYPTLEWVLSFKNNGASDTPIIEDIQAIDLRFMKGESAEFVLHHNRGSMTTPQDFEPLTTTLAPGSETKIGSVGGRPLNTDMPYFNLSMGDRGAIVVLSWLGEWSSSFKADANGGLRVTGGQQKTHFLLHPGEEVRSPLAVVQFWQGDIVHAQNVWRRWMRDHNLPRPGGKPFPTVLSSAAIDFYVGEKDEVGLIEGHTKHDLKVDFWWRDAGWYPCKNEWWYTGTWETDPVRYPNGLRPVADAAHKAGAKMTVWFEPERVTRGSWLFEKHPEWLLGPEDNQKLLDLSNPKAWDWLVNHVDKFLTDNHIDMYRQDYNVNPIGYWRHNEPSDRQGITEIRQVEGMLAYWDELKRRHPDMPFDNCASGGTRNVLEMMRRGVPLSKTDLSGGTSSSQCQLMGLAPWLPYFGSGAGNYEEINLLRSNMAPWTAFCYDTTRSDVDYFLARRFMAECRELSPYMLNGDFYPMTPYSLEENVWAVWQWDLPEKGTGLIQVFRRPKNVEATRVFVLRGLVPGATYEVKDRDTGKTYKVLGKTLMKEGLTIHLPTAPSTALITYRKQ